MNQDRKPEEIGWGDALPPPKEFELVPEGDAQFEVLKLERVRKEMGKLGTVNVAVLTLLVASFNGGETKSIVCNLPLSPKVVFKLYQFFASIGQYRHGDVEAGKPFTPNWAKVVGASGLCVISHRTWPKRDGGEGVSEDVDAFLDDQGRGSAKDKPRPVGSAEPGADAGGDNIKF